MNFGIGEAFSLGCALAWAIAVVLFKKSGESLAPFALNLFKNTLSLALMLITVLAWHGPWLPDIPPLSLLLILVSGVLGIGAGDTLYLRGLNAIGASRMAVAQTLYSPFVIGFSALFLGERLSLLQFAGVGIVLGGIALVTWVRGDGAGSDARALRAGLAWSIVSVLLMAGGVVLAKPMLEAHDFLWVVLLRIAGGLLGMAVVIAWQRSYASLAADFRGVRHWPAVIAGSVMGTYGSMMIWLAGYKYTQASIAAVLNEFAAVFILLLAVLFLKERVTFRQVAGCALAIAGVFVVVAG